MNIFCPPKIKYLDYKEKIKQFVPYWDSYQNHKTGEIENFNGWEECTNEQKQEKIEQNFKESYIGFKDQI